MLFLDALDFTIMIFTLNPFFIYTTVEDLPRSSGLKPLCRGSCGGGPNRWFQHVI